MVAVSVRRATMSVFGAPWALKGESWNQNIRMLTSQPLDFIHLDLYPSGLDS